MPTPSNPPHTIDSLLRVVQARDSEVSLLKLMVDKLTLQLLRGRRATNGQLRSTPATVTHGVWASRCFGTCSTSERHHIQPKNRS